MIPFSNRFHGHSSLNYVYKNGQAVRSRAVTVKYVPNSRRSESRIAVVISKKTLKSAVRRNRIRRRVYEYVRINLPALKSVYDIAIIVTSSDFINLSHQEMSDQINQLFEQARVVDKSKAAKTIPK
ncbi:MAG TPA: ribonuclease P protein component [Candidatus Saccharimonadales bacterium]|nr:ribonuclease P protein component [Candidatus Saccharimonadales bacterium]